MPSSCCFLAWFFPQLPRRMGEDWLSKRSLLMSVCWEKGGGAGVGHTPQELQCLFPKDESKAAENAWL